MKVIADNDITGKGYITIRTNIQVKNTKNPSICHICKKGIGQDQMCYEMYVKSLNAFEKLWARIHIFHVKGLYPNGEPIN
jgi:hypothetical protein